MRNPENDDLSPGESIIPEGERACVWMQAGVIAQWLCDLDFHCERCPLDAALRHSHGDLPEMELPHAAWCERSGMAATEPGTSTTDVASFEAVSASAPGSGPGVPETPSSDLAATEGDGAAVP